MTEIHLENDQSNLKVFVNGIPDPLLISEEDKRRTITLLELQIAAYVKKKRKTKARDKPKKLV